MQRGILATGLSISTIFKSETRPQSRFELGFDHHQGDRSQFKHLKSPQPLSRAADFDTALVYIQPAS